MTPHAELARTWRRHAGDLTALIASWEHGTPRAKGQGMADAYRGYALALDRHGPADDLVLAWLTDVDTQTYHAAVARDVQEAAWCTGRAMVADQCARTLVRLIHQETP